MSDGNIVDLGISPVATPWSESRPCLVCGIPASFACFNGSRCVLFCPVNTDHLYCEVRDLPLPAWAQSYEAAPAVRRRPRE